MKITFLAGVSYQSTQFKGQADISFVYLYAIEAHFSSLSCDSMDEQQRQQQNLILCTTAKVYSQHENTGIS